MPAALAAATAWRSFEALLLGTGERHCQEVLALLAGFTAVSFEFLLLASGERPLLPAGTVGGRADSSIRSLADVGGTGAGERFAAAMVAAAAAAAPAAAVAPAAPAAAPPGCRPFTRGE
mmetsp:Transcript_39919/g.124519  ORF Transcript_39919/g.124519 Transcript_39919/m.124519 type:complete len:119 (+) Transcript_39919:123-479(+)